MQKVMIIGGTGFLGYHAAREFIARGWEVTALGLPPAPPAGLFPERVKTIAADLEATNDHTLRDLLAGKDVLVYAAGVDDRARLRRPAYPAFRHGNVEVPGRLLKLAVESGIKRAVVLGSYFAHFARLWPGLQLAERHPYIRSRCEQEELVTSFPGIEGIVLELPYIFGALPVPGWKPLWTPLVRYLRSARTLFYMQGGTACISARTVACAIAGAAEPGAPAGCYPVGQENLTWDQMLSRLAAADGRQVRVIHLPAALITLGGATLWGLHQLQGVEHGLDARHIAAIQTAETYLDPAVAREAFGLPEDDLDEAFRETVRACQD